MQPSELAKIAFLIWGAQLLAARRMERASLKEMLVPLVPAALIALGLIVLQPDLGQTVSLGIILLALLWYAGPARLRRLIHVEGDVHLAERVAERSGRSVMWLVPHFLALDAAGVATQLFQSRPVASVYQAQSHPVFDAAMRRGRSRFGRGELFVRSDTARPLLRAIRRGHAFFNLPDMDFGMKDSAFVPFFGVPAATLLAPARMAQSMHMLVQPIVVTMLPRGQGYVVRFCDAPEGFDNPDLPQAAAAFNRWLEARIREQPAQYYWVHRRFKTRPEGEAKIY